MASDGTGHAEACRHHQHLLAGVGQESDRAAHRLHDGHEVRGRARLEVWPRPAPGPPALSGPTPVSDRPRCAGHLFHASRRLTEDRDGSTAPLTTAKTYAPMVSGTDHQRTRRMITSSHQELVRAVPGDKGNISHSLQTLEARGLMVIGPSPGAKAGSLWLTSEGQKWASQLAGSCD